jgi:ADP-ribose pyrophosphatase YjhB (NUDIX family)
VTDPAVTEPEPEPQRSPPGRTRVGSYAICLDDVDRILLCRLSAIEVEVGAWTLPGGGIDFGEHPADAVIRELQEETGLTGAVEDLEGVFSHVYRRSRAADGADLHFLGILYRVRVTGGSLSDEADGTTDMAAWHSRDDLANLRIVEVTRAGIELAYGERGE